MNISKSSWHYRLLRVLGMLNAYSNESLCPYFWKVVLAALFAPAAALGILWLGTLPLWWSFMTPDLVVPASLVALAEVIALSSILIILVRDRHEEEILAGTREAPVVVLPVHKEPSLFRLWLKAKHRKVCPMIDFVND